LKKNILDITKQHTSYFEHPYFLSVCSETCNASYLNDNQFKLINPSWHRVKKATIFPKKVITFTTKSKYRLD